MCTEYSSRDRHFEKRSVREIGEEDVDMYIEMQNAKDDIEIYIL
jgi:hypothetical protein